MRECFPSKFSRGFSLLEVIVALSLVALVMLGLVSALAAFGKTATSLDERVVVADEARLISGFLRDTLGRVSTAYRDESSFERPTEMFFTENGAIVWLGVMPARHGVGGLHMMRLSVDASQADRPFMLQYQPYDGGGLSVDWSAASSHQLVSGVERFDVRYRGREAPHDWRAQWSGEVLAPESIAVELTVKGRAWPPLFVTVHGVDPADGGVRIVHGPVGYR